VSSVNLVGITQPNEEYTGCKTAQELIGWCARVSNPANQNNTQTAPKLLKYLITHNHWSPLEMVHVSLEIKTTRDIARQILRHRSFSFQEYSQRYADPTKDLGFIAREARLQDVKNRQNSIDVDDEELENQWLGAQESVQNLATKAYKWAIEHGIAKEVARGVLPEGMMESVLIMSGSLRSFVHYIGVRNHPATQKEHRIVAEQITEIIVERFPDMREYLESVISDNYKTV